MKIHRSLCYYLGICQIDYDDTDSERFERSRRRTGGYIFRGILLSAMCYSFVSKSTDRELVEQYRQEAHSRNYTLQLVALRNWSTYSAYAGTVHFLFSLYCNLFVLNESKCNFVHGYLQKCVVALSTTNRDDRHLVKLFSWSFRLHAAFVAGVLIALLILNAL